MPPASPLADLTVLQLTDSHLFADPAARLLGVDTQENLEVLLRHVRAQPRKADLLLATGDLSQDGSPESYEHFLRLVAPLALPVHALPGNHDRRDSFHAVLGPRAAPVVDHGAWRLILLDTLIPGSDAGLLAPGQLALLAEAGQVAVDRHVLVALHHSPITLGSRWLDTMTIANADQLMACLAGLPRVRALLWGHVHQACDTSIPHPAGPDGARLRLLATPSTCFQFKPQSRDFGLDDAAPGYRWLRLAADGGVDTEVVRVDELAGRHDASSTGY